MSQTLEPARLALLKVRLAILKAMNRWPAGAPGAKGGQFAASQTSGGQKIVAPQYGVKPSGADNGTAAKPNSWTPSGWEGSGMWKPSTPPPPPPGAKPHLKVNDDGKPVTISYPSKPSPASTWSNPKSTATFTPGSATPDVLNGVPFKPWKPSSAGWAAVSGTNPKLDADVPFEPHPTKKTGAGVLIVEPDGRVWLTKPTNEFGGYAQTYPKGTAEDALTLQQNAIKEAWEETGLKVKIVGVLGDYERDTSKARMYIARRVGGTPKEMGWESQAVRLAPFATARDLLNKKHDKAILDDYLTESEFGKAKSPTKEDSTGKAGTWQFQERWPSGTPLGGQWKAMGADGITAPPKIAGGLTGVNSIYQKAANAAHDATQGSTPNPTALAGLVTKYQASADKYASGVKSSSHVKWGAQVHQYATQALTDLTAKGKATASADKISGPQKLSQMAYDGPKPGGSNPGAVYVDGSGKWLVKGSNSAAYASNASKNEVLASKLMAAVGAGAPEMKLVDLEGKHGGGIGVASKWIEGGQKLNPSNPAHLAAAQADFATHAWLANYDAIGLTNDNTQIIGGKAVNIDPGGALLYRAQGQPKGDAFGKVAVEFDSMRKPVAGIPSNPSAHAVYGSMTASQLAASAEKLKAIDPATIKKLVDTYGPGDDYAKDLLTEKLIARRDDILQRVAAMQAPAPAAAPAPAPAVAAPAAPAAGVPESISLASIKTGAMVPTVTSSAMKGEGKAWFTQDAPSSLAAAATLTFNGSEPSEYAKQAYAEYKAASAVGYVAMNFKVAGLQHAYLMVKGDQVLTAAGAKALVAGKAASAPSLDQLHQAAKEHSTAWAQDIKLMHLQGSVEDLNQIAGGVSEFKSGPKKEALSAYVNAALSDLKAKGITGGAPPRAPITTATPAAAPAAPAPKMEKPTFASGTPSAQKYYNKLAQQAVDAHAANDLAALKALAVKPAGKGAGEPAWPVGSLNGKAMGAFHAGLVSDLEAKQAAATMAAVQAAQAAVSKPAENIPAPGAMAPASSAAMPNFEKFKLPVTNSNAASNNAKIDLIGSLAAKGDIKGLVSLNYGTNTYGKKHAQLANDALKALGSGHVVTPGQKANSHTALTGGATPVGVQQAAASTGTAPPQPHPATTAAKPPKPDPTKLDMSKVAEPPRPTFSASSKAHINEANNKLAAELHTLYASGNLIAMQEAKFQTLDKETGKPGAMAHMSTHPAKDLKAYFDGLVAAMQEVANPPEPLKTFASSSAHSVAAISKAFPPKKFGTTVKDVKANEKLGFWIALGQVSDVQSLVPQNVKHLNSTMVTQAYTDYKSSKNSKLSKQFIDGIQSSGSYNDLFRDGKATDFNGNDLKDVAKAALKYAQEKPSGTLIHRWQNMTSDMVSKLKTAPPGTVVQATGSMCSSKSETATKSFGQHKLNIIYLEGAKAVDSFGSGNYQSEQEVTTLPQGRFIIVKSEPLPDSYGKPKGTLEVTMLMLPPDLGIPGD